jgi:DNA-binding MarR family transcriptional regulator
VKKCREKIAHCGKSVEELPILKILKYLDQGFYAQEIARKGLLSAKKLSRIINSIKKRGLITQTHAFPKFYQLTKIGKVFLDRGEISEKPLQNEINERENLPDWVNQIRIHKLRFKDKLISKPSWLYRIKKEGYYSGLYVKRIELTNWTKFIIIFNYQDFNGLEKIEVCNKVIIYNFNRKRFGQFVNSKESLINYIGARINDCKKARILLEQSGFEIDSRDPIFCQNPHFAIASKGDPIAIGSLGQDLILTVKKHSEIREVDDSPKDGGEEETDDIERAKSYFDVPDEVTRIKNEISEMKNAIKEIASGFKTMAKAFKLMANQPDKTVPITNPEGMFK